MSTTKDQVPDEKRQMTLKIYPGGTATVDFFPVCMSEYVIDCVYGKEDRERIAITGTRKIYCG